MGVPENIDAYLSDGYKDGQDAEVFVGGRFDCKTYLLAGFIIIVALTAMNA